MSDARILRKKWHIGIDSSDRWKSLGTKSMLWNKTRKTFGKEKRGRISNILLCLVTNLGLEIVSIRNHYRKLMPRL